MRRIAERVREYGMLGAARRAVSAGRLRYLRWRVRREVEYKSPTPVENARIEDDLRKLRIPVDDYMPSPIAYGAFKDEEYFPLDYHGGREGGVWNEKVLEHWISFELLNLAQFKPSDVYVDIAACTSPWAKVLRERRGLSAFAIDLELGPEYRDLPYYREENAVATSFASGSVRGVSLHCAYEMFVGSDDTALLDELARILEPGGKAVIVPLYMHTHYCAYSTAEFFGRGYSDPNAIEYVRLDCFGVPSSRKYDAATFSDRVLRRIEGLGMKYRLLALRNKEQLGSDVYCHFVLEITK